MNLIGYWYSSSYFSTINIQLWGHEFQPYQRHSGSSIVYYVCVTICLLDDSLLFLFGLCVVLCSLFFLWILMCISFVDLDVHFLFHISI